MISEVALAHTVSYQGGLGAVHWEGRVVGAADSFQAFVRSTVKDRVRDRDLEDPFASELRGLATTGMETAFIERFLRAVPEPEAWEIGEALAECILEKDPAREICWPWNTVRDRRTPRASLPGADLVGFCRGEDAVRLLFGEVKTSSDPKAPPNVMYGKGSLPWQLTESATRLDVQHALLRWLRSRCNSQEHLELYRSAVGRYLASSGKDILLVGILLRDTSPDERDVQNRATALAAKLTAPTQVEIIAWYLPLPIEHWPALLEEASS